MRALCRHALFYHGAQLSSERVPDVGAAAAAARMANKSQLATPAAPVRGGIGAEAELGSGSFTLTLAGSLGNWKNLFGGLLKMPRFSLLTRRFGHPETTHLTIAAVGWSAPDRSDPANWSGDSSQSVDVAFHAPLLNRKRCVLDPETQKTETPESD